MMWLAHEDGLFQRLETGRADLLQLAELTDLDDRKAVRDEDGLELFVRRVLRDVAHVEYARRRRRRPPTALPTAATRCVGGGGGWRGA